MMRISIKQVTFPLLIIFMTAAMSTATFAHHITIFGNHVKPPKIHLAQGKPQGVLIDIMKYVEEHMHHPFKFQLYPWKRAFQNAHAGKGGIVGLSANKERQKHFDYSHAIYYEEIILVVRKDHAFDYRSIADLHNKRVGYLRGGSYGDAFEEGKRNIFIAVEDDGIPQRLLQLLHGRIDVAVIGPGKAGFYAGIAGSNDLTSQQNQFVILDSPFKRDPNYLGFAKSMNMTGFLTQFNSIIDQGRANGDLQKIIEHHAPQYIK